MHELLDRLAGRERWSDVETLAARALERQEWPHASLWGHWVTATFRQAGLDAEALLERLPQPRSKTADAKREEIAHLLRALSSEGSLRISCAREEYRDPSGRLWALDRFHVGGRSARGADKDAEGAKVDELYRHVRDFPPDRFTIGYRVPLPRGRYRLRLHFSEVSRRILQGHELPIRAFDVTVNGEDFLENYSPPPFRVEVQETDVEITDGFLEIGFRPRKDRPMVNAIEILRRAEH